MNQLLSITNKAKNQIKQILANAPHGIDSVVVGIDKSGCSGYSYKIEYANSLDLKGCELINEESGKIFIETKATMFLLGTIMDYQTDKLSSRFVFNNPNEKSTCGCGESFSI